MRPTYGCRRIKISLIATLFRRHRSPSTTRTAAALKVPDTNDTKNQNSS
jgi:hypothetical protein